MKLALLLLSSGLLITGLINDSQSILVTGAILFMPTQLINLVWIYRSSKQYKTNVDQIELSEKNNFLDTLSKWLEGIITFFGLIIMAIGIEYGHGLFVAGAIIWIGVIVTYFLAGTIIRHVTGMPLRMGYGGWHIYRRRRRR